MPTNDGSRKIVLRGLAPGGPASKTAISLVDDAGKTLQSASVNEDGSCELAEEALAAAQEVILGPITLGVRGDRFRALLKTKDQASATGRRRRESQTLDVGALLGGPGPEEKESQAVAGGWPKGK
jgi:hypothetical protein